MYVINKYIIIVNFILCFIDYVSKDLDICGYLFICIRIIIDDFDNIRYIYMYIIVNVLINMRICF